MSKAVSYARVSSREQMEGYSCEAQTRLIRKYAQENGLKIKKEFLATESAKDPGRKVFGEMMEFIKENDIPNILVEKTDRLYRNTRDYVTVLELPVRVHLVRENQVLDYDDFDGMFLHEIQVALAKRYISNLRRETLKGMREKAMQGYYPGRSPIGYLNNTDKKTIEIDPEKTYFIKEIFKLYATGEYSLNRLKDVMDRKGLRGYKRARITKRAIETILKNPFYYGNFYFERKMYQGKHKPIISKSLFDKAQEQLKNRGKPLVKGRHHFPFKGIAKCGYCGCAITAEIKKGRYVYYRCTNGRGKCRLRYFREEEIAEIFKDAVEALRLDNEIIEWVREALVESSKEQNDFITNELQRLKAEYARNEARKEQIYEDKLNAIISESFFKDKFNQVEQRQAEILEDIKHLEGQKLYSIKEGEEILELINSLENQYVKADFENKAKMLKIILSNSVLTNEKPLFSYRKPFDVLAEFGKMELSSATGIRTPV